jgi:hypothetical protein
MITNIDSWSLGSTPDKSPSDYFGPFIPSQSPGDHIAGTSPDEFAQRIPIGLTFWPFRPLVQANIHFSTGAWDFLGIWHLTFSHFRHATLSNSETYKIF